MDLFDRYICYMRRLSGSESERSVVSDKVVEK